MTRRGLLWITAAAILLLYAVFESFGRTTHGFVAYYAAARLLSAGDLSAAVYDDVWFGQFVQAASNSGVLEIFGPNLPTMSVLALPVAWFEHDLARAIWIVASILALTLGSFALFCHARRASDIATLLACVVVVVVNPAVFANIRTGQAYLFVFGLFAVAALAVVRERPVVAGAALGFALILKSTGWPFLLLLAVTHRYRAALVAIVVCVVTAAIVTSVAGYDVWPRYTSYTSEFLQRASTSVTAYQTTRSLARRLCVSDPVWNPFPAANCPSAGAIVPFVVLAIAMIVTIVLARTARTEQWVAAAICLSVLVAPVGAEQHSVSLGAAMIFLWTRPWWPWVVFAVLLFVPLEYSAYRYTDGWSALAAYPRLYAAWWIWSIAVVQMAMARRTFLVERTA